MVTTTKRRPRNFCVYPAAPRMLSALLAIANAANLPELRPITLVDRSPRRPTDVSDASWG